MFSIQGGNPEAIGDTGILVESENPKQLATSLSYLIENNVLHRTLSIKVRERFEKLFNIKAIIESYVNLLNFILNNQRHGRDEIAKGN